MKVSFELPNKLLKYNDKFNDYNYILFHLLSNYKYYKFYKKSNKYSLLDNSAFEFSVNHQKFDIDKFIYYANDLQVNEIIIPDVLGDGENTIKWVDKWYSKYDDKISKDVKRIVVVQGSSFQDWLQTYRYYKRYKDEFSKIAISFGYKWLEDFGDEGNNLKSEKFANGRQKLIHYLVNNRLIYKPLHLLGCYNLNEYSEYKSYDFIESIDTSLPIKFAIDKVKIEQPFKYEKPNIILDDFIDGKFGFKGTRLILDNIKIFKDYLNELEI
jgi:hypothetical protein